MAESAVEKNDRFRWRSRDETQFLFYNPCLKDYNNVLCWMSKGTFTTRWMFWNKGAFLLWLSSLDMCKHSNHTADAEQPSWDRLFSVIQTTERFLCGKNKTDPAAGTSSLICAAWQQAPRDGLSKGITWSRTFMMRWQFASEEADDRPWAWTQKEPKGNLETDLEQIISGPGIPKVLGWVYKVKEP